jgi:hypothetical protein
MQASPEAAESAFQFLILRGFTLEERWITGGQSFKDGWRLSYSSPDVRVIVQYLDAQFEVHFERAGITASYLAIDRDLFGRRSGFHGDMFPPQKLESAVTRIADDIRNNYDQILSGDEGEWSRIARIQTEKLRSSHLPE